MKKLLLPAAMGAAVAGPYVYNHPPNAAQLQGWLGGKPAAGATSDSSWSSWFGSGPPAANLGVNGPYNPKDGADAARLEGQPVADFGEILRFDISTDQVAQRWARVTTIGGDAGLQGLRVTAVTGTQVDDLAGSLTYYFDANHRVQRITLEGTTGDSRRLSEFALRAYQLQFQPTNAAELYVGKRFGRVHSALRVEHAALMRADAPYTRLRFALELNNPQGSLGLSREFADWLARDQGTAKRW